MPTAYLQKRTFFPAFIQDPPHPDLEIIVVIPCYNEANLIASLRALQQARSAEMIVEIMVIINDGEHAAGHIKAQNKATFAAAKSWANTHSTDQKKFHIHYFADLPAKKAGVGLARKIGMDEAARRFEQIGHSSGIITGFDADSLCLDNYFYALRSHFDQYPSIQAASLWYEHPLAGTVYDPKTYYAIAQYELHLRYFTLVKRWANYPHAYETIGSSMAVRADAYQQQGGMNTRKAGEDFYFLNKFMINETLNECNTTTVIPSPRISDRVPFGTGKAVGDLLRQAVILDTYNPQTFVALKKLTALVATFYDSNVNFSKHLPEVIMAFLKQQHFEKHLEEIKANTKNLPSFHKRFYRWFDPFLLMKYTHFARDYFYPNVPVTQAGRWVLEHHFALEEDLSTWEVKELLEVVRLKWKEE